MSVNISQETQDKISALCKKISVAHNLDEEIQKELQCHIEDRLTGYLSGDEQLSEDDAFILVEKHFGNPAAVKALYQNVETVAAHASFARRVGAVLVSSIVIIYTASYVLQIILSLLFTWSLRGNTFPEGIMILSGIPKIIPDIFSLMLFAAILIHWRKNMECSRKLWFLKIKPPTFLGIIIVSLCGMYLIINTTLRFQATSNQLTYTFGWLTVITHCLIWIWWCDSEPRRFLSILYGFISWVAAQILIMFVIASLSVLKFGPHLAWQTIRYSNIGLQDFIHYGRFGLIALGFYILLLGVHSVYMKFKPELAH